MSKTLKVRKVEYTFGRNTRLESYRGAWWCEILLDGKFFASASDDSRTSAQRYAQAKLNQAVREGRVVISE